MRWLLKLFGVKFEECGICGGEFGLKELHPAFDGRGDKCMACQHCIDMLDMRADAEYERQREEGEI